MYPIAYKIKAFKGFQSRAKSSCHWDDGLKWLLTGDYEKKIITKILKDNAFLGTRILQVNI